MGEAKIRVGIFGRDVSYGKTLDASWKKADTFGKKMSVIGRGMQSFGRSMTMYVTGPLVAGMAVATKMAIDEQKEMALLSKALVTNAGATKQQVEATEAWVTATMNATGIADGELRPALASLVAVTKDTAKAQDLMGLAMDISAAKGMPLAQVTKALGKAYLGNVGALGRLGIATKDYTVSSAKLQAAKASLQKAEEDYNRVLKDGDATAAQRAVAAARVATATENLKKVTAGTTGTMMTFEQVMKNAADTYGGAAATAAETTAGKMAILKNKFMDFAENLGARLIPAVDKVLGALQKVADFAAGHSTAVVWTLGISAALGPLSYVAGSMMRIIELGKTIAGLKVFNGALSIGGAGGVIGGAGLQAGIVAAVTTGLGAAVAGAVAYEVVRGVDEGLSNAAVKSKNSSAWQKWDGFWTDFFRGLKEGAEDASGWLDETLGGAGADRFREKYIAAITAVNGALKSAWGQSQQRLKDLKADLDKAVQLPDIKAAMKSATGQTKEQLVALRNSIVANLHVPVKEATKLVSLIFPKAFAAEWSGSADDKIDRVRRKIQTLRDEVAKKLRWGDLDVSDQLAEIEKLERRLEKLTTPSKSTSLKLQLDAATFGRGMDKANEEVDGLDKRTAKPKVTVNNKQALSALQAVRDSMANVRDKQVTVTVNWVAAGSAGGGGSTPTIRPMLAAGSSTGFANLPFGSVSTTGPQWMATTLDQRWQALNDMWSKLAELQSAADQVAADIVGLTDTIMGTVNLWPEYIETVDELGNKVSQLQLPTIDVVNPDDLSRVMDANVSNMKDWVANMDKLRAAGLPQELLDELTAMGLGGAGQVAGLAAMTADQLAKWTGGWLELQKLAGQQAEATYKDAQEKAAAALRDFTTELLNAIKQIRGGVPLVLPADKSTATQAGTGSAVPAMASGGIVTRPTLAWVGEAGTEAVIPLPQGWRSNATGPLGESLTVNVDARGSSSPAEVYEAARRGAIVGYAEAKRRTRRGAGR